MWFSYLKYLQASWDLIFLERSRLEDPGSKTKSQRRKCLVKSDKSLVVEIANQLDSWNNASFKVCNILGEINRHTTLNALKMQQSHIENQIDQIYESCDMSKFAGPKND